MHKFVSIVGARPQFIKVAALEREFAKRKNVSHCIIHTGQHYDYNLSQIFFDELNIPKPSYNLEVGSGTHAEQTAKILLALEPILLKVKPDMVVVYGDTNSTLAAALCAVKIHLPLAHVESGLRSHNRKVPEEINRITTDHISDLLFTPSRIAYQNLLQEGIRVEQVIHAGDVMYDIALSYTKSAQFNAVKAQYSLTSKDYILATVHRAENTDNKESLLNIIEALCELSKEHDIIWPMHPRVKNTLSQLNVFSKLDSSLKVIAPVSYYQMLQLQKYAKLIVTDSGGMQKEAYFCGVPCVTLRNETEWQELVEKGYNKLVPVTHKNQIVDSIKKMLQYGEFDNTKDNFYGNGHAADDIVKAMINFIGITPKMIIS